MSARVIFQTSRVHGWDWIGRGGAEASWNGNQQKATPTVTPPAVREHLSPSYAVRNQSFWRRVAANGFSGPTGSGPIEATKEGEKTRRWSIKEADEREIRPSQSLCRAA